MSINITTSPTTLANTSQGVVEGPISINQNVGVSALQEQIYYQEDEFWPRPKTDLTKWDKYCPYQLLVVEEIPNTAGVPEDGFSYRPYKDWRYTFSLPPEGLDRQTPFAIQVTPTNGGIVEEHNGAPVRNYTIRGSTGFLPLRKSGGDRSGTGALSKLEDLSNSIFGGTIATISSAKNSLSKAIAAATGSSPVAYNVYQSAEITIDGPEARVIRSSGFAQIILLRDFLESYIAIKKKNTDLAQRLRLAFAVWKENDVTLVAPVAFNYTKDASSPLEYRYTLNLKAWKRVELDARNVTASSPVPIRHSPSMLAKAINTLTYARQVVQKIGTIKQAVLGDVDHVFKPFHDTILLGKDLIGTALSVADIPLAVKQRITINISELKYSSKQFWDKLTSSQTWDPAYKALKYSLDDNTHLKDLPVGYRASPTSYHNENRAATALSIGLKPHRLAVKDMPDELLDQIPLSMLKIDADAQKDVLNDIQRIRTLRRKDFEDYANNLRSTADKIAFLVGAGDLTYADAYGVTVTPLRSEPTVADWDSLAALEESINIMQQFAATADGEPKQSVSRVELFGDQANLSGIAWKTPMSKFAIPFPYGATLENLASLYLGDPNRFLEIIALNGLRAPYIDEVGYKLPLVVNGNNKSVVVEKSTDLFVGKTVWLASNVANRKQVKIESIEPFNDKLLIKFNETVEEYKVSDNAMLEAFLTGTISCRNLVWIPSEIDPVDTESVITKDIPGVDETDPMVSIGGVDLLLDNNNDLVLIEDDLRYAVGLANIVQWVKILLSVQKGELLQHKEIGLPLSIGLSLSDFNAQEVVTAIKKQLSQDPVFSRIDKVQVVQNGSNVSIKINAVVSGTQASLPLSYGMVLN